MENYKKLLFIVIITWLTLFSVIFIYSKNTLTEDLEVLEQQGINKNINRVNNQIENSIMYLENFTSYQGQSFNFRYYFRRYTRNEFDKNSRNGAYRNAFNIVEHHKPGIQFIIMMSPYHNTFFSGCLYIKEKNFNTCQGPFKKEIQSIVNRQQNTTGTIHNLAQTSGVTTVISAALPGPPILLSFVKVVGKRKDVKGKPMGTLVFGRFLDSNYSNYLSQSTKLTTKFLSVQEFKENKEFTKGILSLETSHKSAYVFLNDSTTLGFEYLKDYNNKPVMVIQTSMPRNLFAQTKKAIENSLYVQIIYTIISIAAVTAFILWLLYHQEKYIISFERFVPKSFISLLGKGKILDVQLGNYTEKQASILFTDIRNFTLLVEKMTSKESFEFINNLLTTIAPTISKNYGFIDKYIGDAVMALFHRSELNTEDAIRCALSMLDQLDKFNESRQEKGLDPINIGIGINTGSLMFGIVGATDRLDCTVLSDAVNISARLESLTKEYGSKLFITDNSFHQLAHSDKFHIRFIDQLVLKGKTKPVSVYEVYDYESDSVIDRKSQTQLLYQEAWNKYKSEDYILAVQKFEQCLEVCPEDNAARIFLQRSRNNL